MEYEYMTEDEAFFYCYKNDKLKAMVSTHVDNFLIAADKSEGMEIVQTIGKEIEVSKVEQNKFRFTGIDFEKTNSHIKISMEDFAQSLPKVEHIRKENKESPLIQTEHKMYRKIVGKLSWLAGITRPDLCAHMNDLSQKLSKPLLEDLIKINKVVEMAKKGENEIIFKKVGKRENLVVLGISDAAWTMSKEPVGGQIYLLGNRLNDKVC